MTIRIRLVDEEGHSTLTGVEKAPSGAGFIVKTMNVVGGFNSSRHKLESDAVAEFLRQAYDTARALVAESLKGLTLAAAFKDLGLNEDGTVPASARPHIVTLKEAPKKRSICETHMRYDVLANGQLTDTLNFNMRGYQGYLPLPDGGKLDIGEKAISAYKKEISIINKEAKAAFDRI
jgi:hypothetical protein